MKVKGKVFVVTGAGSGIGRAVTLELVRRGAHVAAVDRSADGLAEIAAQPDAAAHISTHVLDVTDKAAVDALPQAVIGHHGHVDGLVHCAGIIQPFVDFDALTDDVVRRVVDVNLWGTIHLDRAFLPVLKARPRAHLVNIASMGGFLPFPGQSVYSATKAAVKSMTEAIYAESIGTGLSVSVVMPGAVATNITANSGVEAFGDASAGGAALSAGDAALQILDGVEADRLHILVGRDARLLWRLTRLMPARAIRMTQKAMKRMLAKAGS